MDSSDKKSKQNKYSQAKQVQPKSERKRRGSEKNYSQTDGHNINNTGYTLKLVQIPL